MEDRDPVHDEAERPESNGLHRIAIKYVISISNQFFILEPINVKMCILSILISSSDAVEDNAIPMHIDKEYWNSDGESDEQEKEITSSTNHRVRKRKTSRSPTPRQKRQRLYDSCSGFVDEDGVLVCAEVALGKGGYF